MTLLELDPVIYRYKGQVAGFYFWCPCCRKVRLTVKKLIIPVIDQIYLFVDLFGPGHANTVPCKQEMCWSITGTSFNDITVSPSLDASKAGHWHGFISNGQIT